MVFLTGEVENQPLHRDIWHALDEIEMFLLMEPPASDSYEHLKIKQLWECIGTELLQRLYRESFPLYAISESGINICQVRYKNKRGEVKTAWLENKLKKKYKMISQCHWTFLPLLIEPRKHSILPEDQRYWFLMRVEQKEVQEDTERVVKCCTVAKIATAKNGILLKSKDANIDQEDNVTFKYKFAFPRQFVSKINRCLANNFFPECWAGPPCAAWHRTDEGRAFYLGTGEPPKNPMLDHLLSLLKGPNGDAASILLAYSCFSILKSFFPSYHVLRKDTPYLEVKKYLPKQIAINIQSDHLTYAERLVDICCGYFHKFEKAKEPGKTYMPITDGIVIQKFPSELKKLGINEFESKVIQPACVLWVNREPARELIEDVKILNIQILEPVADNIGAVLSEDLVYALAHEFHKHTTFVFGKRFDSDWKESIPKIEKFLIELTECARLQFGEFSAEHRDVSEELNNFRHDKSEPKDPLSFTKYVKFRIKSEIDRTLEELQPVRDSDIVDFKEYREQIEKAYTGCVREIRKIHKEKMRMLYSLDSDYSKAVKCLMKNQSVSLVGQENVKKIAYLSTSFRVFAQSVLQSKADCDMLCTIVDSSLISAFKNQLGVRSPGDIIEEYILIAMSTGRCARIRGENSDSSSILVWYNPRTNEYLLPANDYFDNMKKVVPMLDVNRMDFEVMLSDADILRTVQRKKQQRRTFEVVLQKGKGKRSVLKIYAGALSTRFSENAREYLDQMRNDKSPFRSR